MMDVFKNIRIYLLALGLVALFQTPLAFAEQTPTAPQDGQHDFDFHFGTWKTHIRSLDDPFSGSNKWTELSGTVIDRKVWDGRANLEEIEIDGPNGFEGLTLFLYQPASHQWNQTFVSSGDAILSPSMTGSFKDGRGVFYSQDTYNGRTILVRGVWSDITATSYSYEIAYSADGGKTWEPNFIAKLTRVSEGVVEAGAPRSGAGQDGQDAFDFNVGSWNTKISRLMQPLSDSKTWGKYAGTHVVHTVWNGRANLGELEVDGPTGHIEDLALRLFNPKSHQWVVYLANSKEGSLGPPMYGEFKDGNGVFIQQDTFKGRSVLVKNTWSGITADTCHNEWAFSEDGGKTWEVNWIADDTRLKAGS